MKIEKFIPPLCGGDYDDNPFHREEERFCVVDEATGEILDDAQGYGYKTPQKARAAWAYKTRDRSKDDENRKKTGEIKAWMKEHRDFINLLDALAFDIAKGAAGPDDKFDAKFVKEALKENGFTDLGFTPGELLKVISTGSLVAGGDKEYRRRKRK